MFSIKNSKLRRALRSASVFALGGVIVGFGATVSAAGESASNNTVTITGNSYIVNGVKYSYDGDITANVTAGATGISASSYSIHGGVESDGDANNNRTDVSDFDANNREIYGGQSTVGNANNNVVNATNVKNVSFIDAGFAVRGNGDAVNNTINFYSGTVGELHGGHAHYGNAVSNTANIYGGIITQEAGGGYSDYGNVENNTLNVYGGTINGNIYGAMASKYGNGSGDAIENSANIHGGKFNGDIYGGWAPYGSVMGNTLNVYGNPDLSAATLYAGKASDTGITSGNSLNIYTKDLTAKNINGFESLNFYIPKDTVNGDKLLTLTDTAGTDLSNTTVNFNTQGATGLNTGDTVTVIGNDNGLTISDVTTSGKLSEGVSLDYELGLTPVTGDSGNVVGVTATIGERIGDSLKPQTEALAQSTLDGPNLMNFGTERVMRWLPPEEDGLEGGDSDEVEGDRDVERTDFTIFANATAGRYRIKTGNGSYIDSNNSGIDIGAARSFDNGGGKFYIAPIFDYGQDSYDSHMANGVKGSGNTKYFAGGFIARQSNNNGFYVEGSFRYGRINTNFYSADFTMNGVKTPISYETSAPAWAGHINIGTRKKMSPYDLLDVYAVYFHSHQGGMDAELPTGEHYDFDAVNNKRFRLGARLTRATSAHNRFYSGLAYQYEKADAGRGTYRGLSTPESGSSGSSFMLELGWQFKPNKNNPWMVDVGAVGWAGHQQGFSIVAKMKKEF